MLKDMLMQLRTGLILLVLLTGLTGFIYPLVITGFAQIFFPWHANGSLMKAQGQTVGSLFIGQLFSGPTYFWGRPSATTPFPYNGMSSSGSNSGPSNPAFLATVSQRAADLKPFVSAMYPLIPVELVTASGSGLDPDISPLAAFFQVSRVAASRHVTEREIKTLVLRQIKKRTFGVLGEPRINVLQLNLALDNEKGIPYVGETPKS